MKKIIGIVCCIVLVLTIASTAYAETIVSIDYNTKTVRVASNGTIYVGKYVKKKVYTKCKAKVFEEPNEKARVVKVVKKGTKFTRIMKGKTYSVIRIKKKGNKNPTYYYIKNFQLTTKKPVKKVKKKVRKKISRPIYSAGYFRRMGVIRWGGWRWTWYSQRVLPGNGLKIPGRHIDSNGYVCDKDNRICLASNVLGRHTVINTPFGKKGKIYDCGCPSNTIDVYVGW